MSRLQITLHYFGEIVTVAARTLLGFWATIELGIRQVELTQKLKISQPAVSTAVKCGAQLTSRHGYSLID